MTHKVNLKVKTETVNKLSDKVEKPLKQFEFNRALEAIWQDLRQADVFINERKVWSLEGKEKDNALKELVKRIRQIAYDLKPFLPETAEKIEKQFKGPEIKAADPLFPRLK
jgi:methionyl-tRNA synthetase